MLTMQYYAKSLSFPPIRNSEKRPASVPFVPSVVLRTCQQPNFVGGVITAPQRIQGQQQNDKGSCQCKRGNKIKSHDEETHGAFPVMIVTRGRWEVSNLFIEETSGIRKNAIEFLVVISEA